MTQNTQSPAAPETRAFRVDNAIIRSLIASQAGTVEKAVMEGVMNAADAGATRVNLTLDRHGYTIDDDGHGFETREMVTEYFENFGFEHTGDALQNSRTYGAFGIGRGQQWHWASTIYRSRRFEMQVDIRERGLDYELHEHPNDHPGTLITGTFYRPLGTEELFRVRNELKNLVKYSLTPIHLDGQPISIDPATEKWTVITEYAYHRVTDGYQAKVYNLGMLVGNISSRRAGGAGTIVSRVPLKLNMARNDVTEDETTWKQIGRDMRTLSTEKVTKRKRLSEDDLRNLIQDIRGGDVIDTLPLVQRALLITDTNGRSQNVFDFLGRLQGRTPLMMHDDSSAYGNAHIHEKGFAYVLHPKTLGRWEAESPQALLNIITAYIQALSMAFPMDYHYRNLYNGLTQQTIMPDIKTLMPQYSDEHLVKPRNELTPTEVAVTRGLKDTMGLISHAVREARSAMGLNHSGHYFQVDVGQSESRSVWASGSNTVVIEQRQVTQAIKDGDSFMRLILMLSRFAFAPEAGDEDKSSISDQLLSFITEHLPLTGIYTESLKVTLDALYKAGVTPSSRLLTATGQLERLGDSSEKVNLN